MLIFRSIRWKLVLSYVLLTLLTVSLVGVLALSLVKHYTVKQELDYLTANAQAVARQALPLMQPMFQPAELDELARTASFLSNAQVKISNAHGQTLVDSGPTNQKEQLLWIAPPFNQAFGPVLVRVPLESFQVSGEMHLPYKSLLNEPFWGGQLPPGTRITIIHRHKDALGNRIVFESVQDAYPVVQMDLSDIMGAFVDTTPSLGAPDEDDSAATRIVRAPIGDESDPIGYVELSSAPTLSIEALDTARRAFLLAALGATLLAIVVGLGIGQRLTASLLGLTTAAGRMSGGDLSARAALGGQDEIGVLAGQFNQMAERLQASFAELAAERDALRRFITDASHELRTPITALKTFNELLQGPAADDSQASAEFLSESQAQLERLDWITDNLLNLSRLDAGLLALEVKMHDLGEIIETGSAPFKTLAQEQNVTLSVKLPPDPLQITCDRTRIELALSNLLDNALKFASAGGRVEIGGERAEANVRLWVRDDGPGIDPADLPHIFDRFYQGQNGQARDVSAKRGSGLGLAIVQSVVQAHGGQVWAKVEPGAGSLFVIELPIEPGVS